MPLTTYQAYELVQMEERSILNIPAPGASVYLKADADAEMEALKQHHEATRIALRLSGFESRPHACYIDDLHQEIERLKQECHEMAEYVYACERKSSSSLAHKADRIRKAYAHD